MYSSCILASMWAGGAPHRPSLLINKWPSLRPRQPERGLLLRLPGSQCRLWRPRLLHLEQHHGGEPCTRSGGAAGRGAVAHQGRLTRLLQPAALYMYLYISSTDCAQSVCLLSCVQFCIENLCCCGIRSSVLLRGAVTDGS